MFQNGQKSCLLGGSSSPVIASAGIAIVQSDHQSLLVPSAVLSELVFFCR
jgi:hypothetical protein